MIARLKRQFDVLVELYGLLHPWRRQLLLTGVAVIVSTGASLVPPYVAAQAIDDGIIKGDVGALDEALIVLVVAVALYSLTATVQSYASAAEVEDAARRAHADEVAARRPDGYDTEVGESGGQLSGGERQRIGLARALLVGRPILLLDHVTSALDPPAANEVLERLAQGTSGMTRVMATYRQSALTLADRIVVLDAGRVVETGTYDELVAQGGRFAALAARDFDSFDADAELAELA